MDYRLRRTAWARTLVLIITSIACLIMCQAYIGGIERIPSGNPIGALQILDQLGGLRCWAIAFGAAGVVSLVVAIRGCRCTWLILATGALWGTWGFVFLSAWILGIQPRGYVTATSFLLIEILHVVLLLLPSRSELRTK